MLRCYGKTKKTVECYTELKFAKPIPTQIFAIARQEEVAAEPTESKYRIIPRKLDNSSWLIDQINDIHISLYHSSKYSDYGLFVKDKVCFKNLDN